MCQPVCVRVCRFVPKRSIFTSFCIFRWSSRNCFSISRLFLRSGSSLLPLPKHMMLPMAIHGTCCGGGVGRGAVRGVERLVGAASAGGGAGAVNGGLVEQRVFG
jgi:hypothetical protein